jgi:sensor histidine kinase regulating citrate/malate metabolism
MDINQALQTIDHAAHQDDRWMFVALLLIGLVTIYFLARYFMRQIAELQQEIAAVRTEFETHLKTANADMVAALTKSSEVIAHNSVILEQLQRKLTA